MSKKTGPTISRHVRGGYYTTLTIKGKKNFFYGKTEDDVLQKYTTAKYLHNLGYNISDNPSMRDYTIRWFNIYKKGKGAVKTQEMYMNAVNVHVIPALGKKKIKDITTTDIQELLNKITSSRSLQHKVRITLNQIFKKAQADRLIPLNPVTSVETVDAPPPTRNFYNSVQRAIIIKVLDNHNIFPLIFTILHTGLRATEAIALMRQRDLNLDKNIINVRESTEFVKSKPIKKGTKTKRGEREIPIPYDFAKWLKGYLENVDSLYVFPGHHNRQMGQTEIKNLQRRANNKLLGWFDVAESAQAKAANKEHLTIRENELLIFIKTLGINNISDQRFELHFKTLRHTYCTELFDLGVDEVSAAAIMGHTVTVMREIYTHIQNTRKKQTAVKIDQLYSDKLTDTVDNHE